MPRHVPGLVSIGSLLLVVMLPTVRLAAQGPIVIESAVVTAVEAVDVPAQTEGLLREVRVERGHAVEVGDRLAQLQDDQARIAVEKARLEVAMAQRLAGNELQIQAAEKELALAQVELSRLERTKERFEEAVSRSELDRKNLAVEQATIAREQAIEEQAMAKLTLELKQSSLQLAQQVLQERQLVAPFSGVVTEVYRQAGEWLQPGEKVLRLIRMDRLQIEGHLVLEQVDEVRVGSPVTLVVDLPGQPQARYTGSVVFISPEFDPFNHRTVFRAELDNRDGRLRPGLRGELSIATSEQPR